MITSAAPSSSGASSPSGGSASCQPSGGASKATRMPALSPSFRACGVPVIDVALTAYGTSTS